MGRVCWWGNQAEREPLRRCRRRLVDNIKMVLKIWTGGGWIDLSLVTNKRRAVVKVIMGPRSPQNSRNVLNVRGTLNFMKDRVPWGFFNISMSRQLVKHFCFHGIKLSSLC
jgi:hypothetical protein